MKTERGHYRPCHVVGNLVRQRARMLRCRWASLSCVTLLGALLAACLWQGPEDGLQIIRGRPAPEALVRAIDARTRVVRERVSPFRGSIRIVPARTPTAPAGRPRMIARVPPAPSPEVPSLPLVGRPGRAHGGDLELPVVGIPRRLCPAPLEIPPVRAPLEKTAPPPRDFTMSAVGACPQIVVEEGFTTPSLRFLSEDSYVAGWLYFGRDGWFKFEPLPGESNDLSDAAYRFLAEATTAAYARTPCSPARVEGVVVTVRVRLNVYFVAGDAGERRVLSCKPVTL